MFELIMMFVVLCVIEGAPILLLQVIKFIFVRCFGERVARLIGRSVALWVWYSVCVAFLGAVTVLFALLLIPDFPVPVGAACVVGFVGWRWTRFAARRYRGVSTQLANHVLGPIFSGVAIATTPQTLFLIAYSNLTPGPTPEGDSPAMKIALLYDRVVSYLNETLEPVEAAPFIWYALIVVAIAWCAIRLGLPGLFRVAATVESYISRTFYVTSVSLCFALSTTASSQDWDPNIQTRLTTEVKKI